MKLARLPKPPGDIQALEQQLDVSSTLRVAAQYHRAFIGGRQMPVEHCIVPNFSNTERGVSPGDRSRRRLPAEQ